jgi:fucose 4-O-acetylase-like acetyltransferase
MKMRRREDLDRAKGLAILLVVFGHLVARTDPLGVDWYEPLRRAIYAFHMPFFFYLSGMVAALSGALFTPIPLLGRLAVQRARRLLAPFFALGLLILLGKLIAGHFVFVDNQPAGFWSGLAALLDYGPGNPAISIWYLFVLFVFSIAAPLLVAAGGLRLLLAAGASLYALPLPGTLFADHIAHYLIFFALGAAAADAGKSWLAFVDQYWRPIAIGFFLTLAIIIAFGAGWPQWPELLPAGVLSIPVLHGFVRNCGATSAAILHWMGRYCFSIYLFNTLFIGLAKGLLLQAVSWNGGNFPPFALALMVAGILGPVALKHLALRRNPMLDRLTS